MIKKLLIVAICLIASNSFADNLDLKKKIDQIINKVDPNLNIGVKVTNLTKNKVILRKNTNRYFIPASTLKFVTLTSFLKYFGEDYKLGSTIYKLENDYYLDINDPNFSLSELTLLVNGLQKSHGNKIDGDFYIIDNKFSVPPIIRDINHGDSNYCYGAPITKTHINKNCTKLTVFTNAVGEKISVTSFKEFPFIIDNKAFTIKKYKLNRLNTYINDDKFIIEGNLSQLEDKLSICATSNDNIGHLKSYIKKLFKLNNMELSGEFKLANSLPNKTTEIITINKTLKDIVKFAMQKSDNFITDYLLAMYATQNNIKEWDWAMLEFKKAIKTNYGIDIEAAELKDASGLSKNNLITINHIDSVLKYFAKSSQFNELLDLLAQPNNDSNLRGRFKNMKIYAKTGSLNGVSGIVGYFYDKKNELYSFVIIANNFIKSDYNYKELEEKIIRAVASN